MKRFIFAGMAFALTVAWSSIFAQNNGEYTDDVYYNASQAEQDALEAAKAAADQESSSYYSSGEGLYNTGNYDNNDTYIDYDDDSYTMRMRRFYYPMSGIGYWGSVYSPYWNDPFYRNPYYGWGYTPGFSISFGYGPYWSNSWGWNTWYGYGGFNPWYYPYYGYSGYGAGYWNGYYAGLYDGNGYYNHARGAQYGPRGARNSRGRLYNSGNYGTGRTAPVQAGRTMVPQRGERPVSGNSISRQNSPVRVIEQGDNSRNAIRLHDRNTRVYDNNNGATRTAPATRQETRGSGLFRSNRNNQRTRGSRPATRSYQRTEAPAPQRNYTPPRRSYSAPERSYTPSRSTAPSRSSFGGSSRSSGRR